MSYIARRTSGAGPPVLTFHGTGGSEDQFHSFAEEMLPGSTVISPRGDISEMGASRFFRRTAEGVYDMGDLSRATGKMADFIQSETNEAALAFGYSNGANILASVSFARPELFERIVLLHPLIPFAPPAAPGLSGKKILITAGERDPICPPEQTRSLVAYYTDQGADVSMLWHAGGHEIRPDEVEALTSFLRMPPAT